MKKLAQAAVFSALFLIVVMAHYGTARSPKTRFRSAISLTPFSPFLQWKLNTALFQAARPISLAASLFFENVGGIN